MTLTDRHLSALRDAQAMCERRAREQRPPFGKVFEERAKALGEVADGMERLRAALLAARVVVEAEGARATLALMDAALAQEPSDGQ